MIKTIRHTIKETARDKRAGGRRRSERRESRGTPEWSKGQVEMTDELHFSCLRHMMGLAGYRQGSLHKVISFIH